MKKKHLELLERLENYPLSNTADALPFEERLARDQGWTLPFARQVIQEYKRFAFLAVAAGHPVAPSGVVAEAWHLHLLHTHPYWNEFCPVVLGTPLHHYPSRGGTDERTKLADWYQRTLASYRMFFGEAPPSEIWPDEPDLRPKPAHAPTGYWLLRKPRWALRLAALGLTLRTTCDVAASKLVPSLAALSAPTLLCLAVAFLLAGCSWSEMPFNWRGPGGCGGGGD